MPASKKKTPSKGIVPTEGDLRSAAASMIKSYSKGCIGSWTGGNSYKETKCTCIKDLLESWGEERLISRLLRVYHLLARRSQEDQKEKVHHRRLVDAMHGFKTPYLLLPVFTEDDEELQMEDAAEQQYEMVCQNAFGSFLVSIKDTPTQVATVFNKVMRDFQDVIEGYRHRIATRMLFSRVVSERVQHYDHLVKEPTAKVNKYIRWSHVRNVLGEDFNRIVLELPSDSGNDPEDDKTVATRTGTVFSGRSNMSTKTKTDTLGRLNEKDERTLSTIYRQSNLSAIHLLHEAVLKFDVTPNKNHSLRQMNTPELIAACKGYLKTIMDDDARQLLTKFHYVLSAAAVGGVDSRTCQGDHRNITYTLMQGDDIIANFKSSATREIRKLAEDSDDQDTLRYIQQQIYLCAAELLVKSNVIDKESKETLTMKHMVEEDDEGIRRLLRPFKLQLSTVCVRYHSPQPAHIDVPKNHPADYGTFVFMIPITESGLPISLWPQPGPSELCHIPNFQIYVQDIDTPYSVGAATDSGGHVYLQGYCCFERKMELNNLPIPGDERNTFVDPLVYCHHPHMRPIDYDIRPMQSFKGFKGVKKGSLRKLSKKPPKHLASIFYGDVFTPQEGIREDRNHPNYRRDLAQVRKMIVKDGLSPERAITLVRHKHAPDKISLPMEIETGVSAHISSTHGDSLQDEEEREARRHDLLTYHDARDSPNEDHNDAQVDDGPDSANRHKKDDDSDSSVSTASASIVSEGDVHNNSAPFSDTKISIVAASNSHVAMTEKNDNNNTEEKQKATKPRKVTPKRSTKTNPKRKNSVSDMQLRKRPRKRKGAKAPSF